MRNGNGIKRAQQIEDGHLRRIGGNTELSLQYVTEMTCRSAETIPDDVLAALNYEAIRNQQRQEDRRRFRESRNGGSPTEAAMMSDVHVTAHHATPIQALQQTGRHLSSSSLRRSGGETEPKSRRCWKCR